MQLNESFHPQSPGVRIGIWLLEAFDFYTLANALEPLRLANQVAGRSVCHWQILSLEGQSLNASNGITTATKRLDQAQPLDALIVCGGENLHTQMDLPDLNHQLHRWAKKPISLGAMGKAGWLLAQVGALDGYRCSLPEPEPSSSLGAFNKLTLVAAPFCIDRQRLTCVGPLAVKGLMHELLARTHGRSLILGMEKYVARQVRPLQRTHNAPAKLQEMLTLMSEHLTRTLPINEMAEAIGISCRHLERLFKKNLGCSPSRYYLYLRLQQANQLLQSGQRQMPDVARDCGFVSVQHFIRCYRHYFGVHPRDHLGVNLLAIGDQPLASFSLNRE